MIHWFKWSCHSLQANNGVRYGTVWFYRAWLLFFRVCASLLCHLCCVFRSGLAAEGYMCSVPIGYDVWSSSDLYSACILCSGWWIYSIWKIYWRAGWQLRASILYWREMKERTNPSAQTHTNLSAMHGWSAILNCILKNIK